MLRSAAYLEDLLDGWGNYEGETKRRTAAKIDRYLAVKVSKQWEGGERAPLLAAEQEREKEQMAFENRPLLFRIDRCRRRRQRLSV